MYGLPGFLFPGLHIRIGSYRVPRYRVPSSLGIGYLMHDAPFYSVTSLGSTPSAGNVVLPSEASKSEVSSVGTLPVGTLL